MYIGDGNIGRKKGVFFFFFFFFFLAVFACGFKGLPPWRCKHKKRILLSKREPCDLRAVIFFDRKQYDDRRYLTHSGDTENHLPQTLHPCRSSSSYLQIVLLKYNQVGEAYHVLVCCLLLKQSTTERS